MTVKCDRCGGKKDKCEVEYYEVNKLHYGHYCQECAEDLNLNVYRLRLTR